MKQRIAYKTLAYTALSLSLLGTVAHAQLIELEPAAADVADTQTQAVAAQGSLSTQPVGLSAGMNPSVVPSAQSNSTSTATVNGVAVPSTAGNSNGNSNGPGTQINLNIQNDQDAKQAMEADQSRLSELRMEKKIREKVNEERLMEKIEEDRITGERTRTGGIERFSFGTEPVAVAEADAGAMAVGSGSGAAAGATAIAVAGNSGGGFLGSGVQFKISPVIGWKWYQMYSSMYRPVNLGTFGLALEGDLNKWFGLEGSFMYGRDRYVTGALSPYGMAGAPMGGMGYPGQAGMAPAMAPMGYPGYIMPQSRDSFEAAIGAKVGYEFSSVRPFVTGGIGGLFQRYNIDNMYTVDQLRYVGLQRATNYFMGNFGAGADFNVARNFALGGRFDYQVIFNGMARYLPMNQIWGDTANRFRLTASAQIVF